MRRLSRRAFLGAAGAAVIVRPALADEHEPRRIKLYNPHTDESWDDVFRDETGYLGEAWDRLNWFMRDHYENVASVMDPGVFDLLWRLQRRYAEVYGRAATVNIHSAFRTEATNERLRREGAVQNSFHKYGRAVDVSMQGFGIWFLLDQVQAIGAGGRGIYMRGQFAHIDTGPPRQWVQPIY